MSKLKKSIGKRFTITTEVKPPRGADTTKLLRELSQIKKIKKITAVNVIDSPSARLYMSSLGASILLRQKGVEPIFQMVCRDRNVLALESDLLSASVFGIENILALTGDHPSKGASDHPHIKPVYDLDSTSLIKAVNLMNQSTDLSGTTLDGATDFFVGAAISPNVVPKEPEMLKIRRKIEAGAGFFQTQPLFTTQQVKEFNQYIGKYAPEVSNKTLVGLIPLTSEKMITFLNHLPGINVPKEVAERVCNSRDPSQEGVNVCIELADEIKKYGFGGVHIMPVGKTESLKKILSEI